MPRYEEDLESEGLVGDERPRGHGELGEFYQPGAARDPWYTRLRSNPHRSQVPAVPSMVEGVDEQQWGQQRTVNIDASAGTGPYVANVQQLVQATRPARTWSIDFAFSLPNVLDLSTVQAPNGTLQVTFIYQLGLGTTYVKRYVQLRDTDLVAFAPDPSFPTRVDTPIASVVLSDLPAKQIIVSANILYDRITLTGAAKLQLLTTCLVAPVYR